MTHDKPEPPDMRGEAFTLRQKIQDRIEEHNATADAAHHIATGGGFTITESMDAQSRLNGYEGAIEALEWVLSQMDDQEIRT